MKRGVVRDVHRIEQSLPTLYNIVERGGRPVLMTHVGRPYDKKTKTITVDEDDAATAVAFGVAGASRFSASLLRAVSSRSSREAFEAFGAEVFEGAGDGAGPAAAPPRAWFWFWFWFFPTRHSSLGVILVNVSGSR